MTTPENVGTYWPTSAATEKMANAPSNTLRGPNRVISVAFSNIPAAMADRKPV